MRYLVTSITILFIIINIMTVPAYAVNLPSSDGVKNKIYRGIYCFGQNIEVTNNRYLDEGSTIDSVNSNVSLRIQLDDNRTVINTTQLSSPGDYIIKNSSGEILTIANNGTIIQPQSRSEAAISVVRCQFEANIENEVFTIREPGEELYIQVDSTVTRSIVITAPRIPDNIFAEMVGGYPTSNGVRVEVPEDGRIPVTFTRSFICQLGDGNYTWMIKSVQTGNQTNVSFTAATFGDRYAWFLRSTLQTERGAVTRVPIAIGGGYDFCPGGDTVTLQLDSNDSGYQFQTLVVDRDDDGVVRVDIDTTRAGRTLDDGALTAVGNDTLRNTSLVQAQATSVMQPGTYHMRLLHNGSEVSVGQLSIGSTETTTPTTARTTASPTAPAMSTTTQTSDTESLTPMSPTTSAETGPGFGILMSMITLLLSLGWIALRS